jgi:hypothetical protein
MATPLPVSFVGGADGPWEILSSTPVIGTGLAPAARLAVVEGDGRVPEGTWVLRGVTSNERYVERAERSALAASQPPLGRPEATTAALIPIRKDPVWWALAQDERRAILEGGSHHIETGLRYLPAVARRLHHCRDLGGPFDFLTWFELAPADADAFEELVGLLRTTEEWSFVDREVDLRLARSSIRRGGGPEALR